MKYLLSFDIGIRSIGWAILKACESVGQIPEILGCGSVIFPADDCLASQRRIHRRSRRNIRATRQRIARIKLLLLHLGVLSEKKLNAKGHPAPHYLAAKALVSEGPTLSWLEIWHVIRWYAHNRGYDGNSRWARQEENTDDSKREKEAIAWMEKYGTKTMAETVCAHLGIDPAAKKISSEKPFKILQAAFPRKIVCAEVLQILNKHKRHLSKMNEAFIATLIASDSDNEQFAWKTIEVPGIKMPKRYHGGLLFGQLLPRFDNRIIGLCPFTGDKLPKKATIEFLGYRWAMILANLRVDEKPLAPTHRQKLHASMKLKGSFTAGELRKELEHITGSKNNNVKTYFEITPNATDALVYDPALALYQGRGSGSDKIECYWDCLPEIIRKRALGRWKKGRLVNLNWMISQCGSDKASLEKLECVIEKAFKGQKGKKSQFATKDHFLNQSFEPQGLTGRAPYSRKVMREVIDFVLKTNRHPTEGPAVNEGAGPLYRTEAVIAKERQRDITELTNNHLIRQRLDILKRLLDDIICEYAKKNPNSIKEIVVEVARDLQTFSGLSNKEMTSELNKRIKHFETAKKWLEKEAPGLKITGSLIRKCRTAMDQGWKCPYTDDVFRATCLPNMHWDHIIPYADRPTNALDAQVLTFPWVNKLKGKRTALAFVKEMNGRDGILPPEKFKSFVKNLKVANKKKSPDDYRRQANRKKYLLIEDYNPNDLGFTAGALTQTSHLDRLAARQIEKCFINSKTGKCKVQIHSIPGQVTGEIRKSWSLLSTLAKACPEILDDEGKVKNKSEVRGITHLHHALDAAVLALCHFYLPGTFQGRITNEKGAIWAAMLKRNKTQPDIRLLMQTGMFAKHYKNKDDPKDKTLDVHLKDIPKEIKEALADRLAERRVVQHVPADQSGSHLELNPWRLRHIDGEIAIISQLEKKVFAKDKLKTWESAKKPKESIIKKRLKLLERCPSGTFSSDEYNLINRNLLKLDEKKLSRLVGLSEGKLSVNQSVLIINENFGVALLPEPQAIPFHKVSKQLQDLREKNNCKLLLVLKKGDIIKVKEGVFSSGVWRVASIKNNQKGFELGLCRPEKIKSRSSDACLKPLMKNGIMKLHPKLTFHY